MATANKRTSTVKRKTARAARSSNEEIFADWDTGDWCRDTNGTHTQTELAEKHNIDPSQLTKLLKGRPEGFQPQFQKLVQSIVDNNQQLANMDSKTRSTVEDTAAEKSRHIQFFTDITVRNLNTMMKKIDGPKAKGKDAPSIFEHRVAQAAIKEGRETVLGKTPETQVNVQTNVITKIERVIIRRGTTPSQQPPIQQQDASAEARSSESEQEEDQPAIEGEFEQVG